MSIKPWREFFPILIGLVIPVFFILIYFNSVASGLRLRLGRCREAFARLLEVQRRRQPLLRGLIETVSRQPTRETAPLIRSLQEAHSWIDSSLPDAASAADSLRSDSSAAGRAEVAIQSVTRVLLDPARFASPAWATSARELETLNAEAAAAAAAFNAAVGDLNTARARGISPWFCRVAGLPLVRPLDLNRPA